MADINIINFYDELGLDRDASVATIQEDLKNLKTQLASKVSRPSSQQDKWKRQLELVEQAEAAFKDEDSRERYNIELRRAGTTEEAQVVDWTTRAWNYYFIRDFGAALVAARKAKEQAPNQPMPYVVSSWIQITEKELKRAKQDADEAFVLDELTTDSVDVQFVRGAVYFLLGDYDRALTSFDRALAKASKDEKPEVYWWQGRTYEAMKSHKLAYESCMNGLSLGVDIVPTLRDGLDKLASDSINHLCNDGSNADESIAQYTQRSQDVSSGAAYVSSKQRLVGNIDENLGRCRNLQVAKDKVAGLKKKIKDLEQTIKTLGDVRDATGAQPGFPLIAIGAAIVFFFIMIGVFQVSGGAGFFLLLVVGAIVAYVVVRINKRSQWTQVRDLFSSSQARLESAHKELGTVNKELNSAQSAIPPLTTPIWLQI